MSYYDNLADKQREAETDAYKTFMVIAKKLKKIDYASKWELTPDPKDPCRKFTLNRDIGWTTIKLQLSMKQSYHRGNYNDDRFFYKAELAIGGLFSYNLVDQPVNLHLVLKPRVAKKIVDVINTVVIPSFYKAVTDEVENRRQKSDAEKEFMANLKKVEGLELVKQQWGEPIGKLPKCPFKLNLDQSQVEFTAAMSYDEFAQMSAKMGWGK